MNKIHKRTNVQSYKHDEQIHRIWRQTTVVKADDKKIVAINKKTKVVEKNGRTWYTKEPAVWYFYLEEWFNVIAMMRNDGVYYYCNLSSPAIMDDEGIKYIDYDLDFRVYPNGDYKILDENEYTYNSNRMNYPEEIKNILTKYLDKIKKLIETKAPPFNEDYVLKDYNNYIKRNKK